MNKRSSFHLGEIEVQKRANESAVALRNSSVVSNTIMHGAIPFIAQQSMLVLSSLDKSGNPWSSLLVGSPGFIRAPNEMSLLLDTEDIINYSADPLWENIKTNPQVGLLVIELSTRRRFRVNGRIRKTNQLCYEIIVEQAFPNCPKFIQRRSLQINDAAIRQGMSKPKHGVTLTNEQIKLIEKSDSFFVSSAGPANELNTRSVDASHRGGFPGFVEIIDDKYLRIPDYQGNSMFNTLGNIHAYPKAGIVFVDFENGHLLQLSGSAEILWDQVDPSNKSDGTQRFWQLTVEQWQESKFPTGLKWNFSDYSPHNPRDLMPQTQRVEELSLTVSRIEQKGKNVRLFRLTASDGRILPAFEPGAHLPLDVILPDGSKTERHYSLISSSHENRYYEIAVLRELNGRGGSDHMHQNIHINTIINAKPPRNEFPLSPVGEHTILIAGGIGITPILSMLNALVEAKVSFEIHYTARTLVDLAFKNDVLTLAGNNAHLYFSNGIGAKKLEIKPIMNNQNASTHIFVCGPTRMISEVRELGELNGWKPSQIHFESFGASTAADDTEIKVTLKKSAKIISVKPTQTILDALIESNVDLAFDCKRGECGMCATGVLAGEIDHRDIYLNKQERQQQMCVCVSRAKGTALTLDL